MNKKQGHFHTDAFTRGGQIFSHEWRMKVQNFRTVFLWTSPALLGGIWISFIWSDINFWLVWDFYIMTYLSGSIKVFLWPHIQSFLINLDMLLRGLMKGSQGIPEAYKSLSQLTTDLWVPEKGRIFTRTIEFIKHPWAVERASCVHSIFIWGFSCWLTSALGMMMYFRIKSKKIEKDKFLRGKEIESVSSVARKVRKLGEPDFEIAPGLPLPKGTENQHIAIIGATRMGKTTCFIYLLDQVRKKGQRAVILDSTGEFTNRYYRSGQDILFNPFDSRSVSWNIWRENLNTYEYDAWSAAMIPEGKGDPIWHGNARKLLSFTVRKLGNELNPTMKDILRWCCWEALGEATERFYDGSPVAALMRPQAEKTTAGIRMQAGNSIAAFEYLADAENSFSMTQWINNSKDKDQWLFLNATPTQRSTLAPLLASLFNFAFMGLERSGVDFKNRIFMIADELGGWNFPIASLKRLVTEGAKYGACCGLGFQNKSQVDELYNHAGTKTLLSNCSTKLIFSSQDHETNRDLSLTLGEQDILTTSENFSIGSHHMRDGVNLSAQHRTQAVITATDITSLDKLEAYVLLPGNLPLTKVKFKQLEG